MPLVMKLPKRLAVRDEVVPDPVELVDVAPTVLGFLGLAAPPGMVGTNLMPAVLEKRTLPARPVVAESESGVMLLSGGLKYVHVPTAVEDYRFLYDTRRDPLEEHNIAGADPEDLRRMADATERIAVAARERETVTASAGIALTEEEVERMKSLGYLHN